VIHKGVYEIGGRSSGKTIKLNNMIVGGNKMKAVEIYSKMHTLRNEVKEFQKALETLSDEIGTNTVPYKLMKKLYDEKSAEAIEFENKEFEEK
jgi:adenosyl cobinamide kinase/adenosyl cobinamide phosphate guanylyltransferase